MVAIRRILCPTDFSDSAQVAVDYGTAFAAKFGASLVLLHVIPPTSYPLRNLGSISGFPNLRDEIHKRVTEELETIKSSVKGVEVDSHIVEGTPHDAIIDAASQHGCDMIVMSTHGHTGLKHAFLGSTAERVVRLSPCPVLTLRAPGNKK